MYGKLVLIRNIKGLHNKAYKTEYNDSILLQPWVERDFAEIIMRLGFPCLILFRAFGITVRFSVSIKNRCFNGQSNRVGIYNWFHAFLKRIKLSHVLVIPYTIYLIPNLPLTPFTFFYLSFFSSKFHMCLLVYLSSKFCFSISHIYWIILFQEYLSNLFQMSLFILRYFICLTFI